MTRKRAMARTRATLVKRPWLLDYESIGSSQLCWDLVAGFKLEKRGRLSATWADERLRVEIEAHGIATAAGVFRPSDGRPFFEALPIAFSHSTTIRIEDAPADRDSKGQRA